MKNNTCSVCSEPLGEAWSTCLCFPSHGNWHDSCDPHKPNEEWWEKEPYKICGPLSDWFDIEKIVAESTRRARLEMAREMKDLVRQERRELPTDDGFWLACSDIMSKLDVIIQEEEKI